MDSSQNEVATLPAVAHTSRPSHKDHLQRAETYRSRLRRRPKAPVQDISGLSPGEQSQLKHLQHLMARPNHPVARDLLNHYYHLPLNVPQDQSREAGTKGKVMTGTTVEHLTTLPRTNRRNAMLTPPAIQQKDARKGLFSLLQRGLIPPAAELVLSPPPVAPHKAHLHSAGTLLPQQRPQIADGSRDMVPASVKLDPCHSTPLPELHIPNAVNKTQTQSASSTRGTLVSLCTSPLPPIRPQSSRPHSGVQSDKRSYHIIVNNGRLAESTNDFIEFKTENMKHWHSLQHVLDKVLELCQTYLVPVCILDCHRLLEVCRLAELGLRITRDNILDMAANERDVEKILAMPGRRFRGRDGEVAAANKIRATYLMYRELKRYREHHRKKWAADVVGTAWMTFMRIYKIKRKLKETRSSQLAAHRQRTVELRRSWVHIQTSRRCVVHVPSLGHPGKVRATIQDLYREQSLQIGRICDLQDESVDVIYVSPVDLDKDTLEYYIKLLSMRQLDEDTPSSEDEDTPKRSFDRERLHVVIPENLEAFRSCRMSLSTVLLYSPKGLARIRRLVAGRPAYIVSGLVSMDDIALADTLDLPLLGSEPDVSGLYSSKAGARCLLKETTLPLIPPYEPDIFSEKKLIDCLARLVTNNLLVPRWLFKLNQQVQGRGFAYCDVIDHLPCYQHVLKEAHRYGSKWSKPWAQEQALQLVSSQLPALLHAHTHVVSHTLYPTWTQFLQHFIQEGGLIEATPPSDSSTALTVDLVIEPTGDVKVLTTADQVCGQEYNMCGGSIPQCSLEHHQLMATVEGVAMACKNRGILGHLTLDLITFIDPDTLQQAVWCVDLDLCYSDLLALYQVTSHVMGLQFNSHTGTLELEARPEERRQVFATLLPHLHHTHLSFLYPAVFFQVCKAHHIGYDNKERRGTLFCLADEKHRNYVSMACVDESLMSVMELCATNLTTIHQELSTPTLITPSNFKVIARELQEIAELMKVNNNL